MISASENLMNSNHKSVSDKYRDGHDAINWLPSKEKSGGIVECCRKEIAKLAVLLIMRYRE